MPPRLASLLTRRSAGLLAILALALAAAYPMQVNGWNQNAHYALVRALADGTPAIDQSRREIGDLGTGDVSSVSGRTYSNKAPGLAFAALPSFLVLDAAGMRTTGDPTRIVWALHVAVIVPAYFLVLLLVRRMAEAIEPGLGTAVAVTVGLATLLLPFATMFFSHVLAAALTFAAFAVLWREREGTRRLALVAAAGVVAGLAVTVEYPPAIAGAILGLYAVARGDVVRRGAAYAAGVLAGVTPLLLYNLWAFGSITHLSYDQNQVEKVEGFLAAEAPSLSVLGDLLFSGWGLLVNTPVVACGLLGAVALARRGRRPEALVLLAVPIAHLLYNSAITFSAFGGFGLPRYLIYTLPFLGVGLAASYRSFPMTTIGLAIVSAVPMVVMTATNALAAYDGDWLDRLQARDVTQTAAAFVGVTGWYTILAFFAAIAAAALLAIAATPRLHTDARDLVTAPLALVAWAIVALAATNPQGQDFRPAYVVAVAGAAGLVALALARPRRPLRPTPA